MTDKEGYSIGFKELYELVEGVDKKIDNNTITQVNHEGRITALEKNAEKRWQLYGIWITAVAALASSVVAPLITK